MQPFKPASPRELHAQMSVVELLDRGDRLYVTELPSTPLGKACGKL